MQLAVQLTVMSYQERPQMSLDHYSYFSANIFSLLQIALASTHARRNVQCLHGIQLMSQRYISTNFEAATFAVGLPVDTMCLKTVVTGTTLTRIPHSSPRFCHCQAHSGRENSSTRSKLQQLRPPEAWYERQCSPTEVKSGDARMCRPNTRSLHALRRRVARIVVCALPISFL